jgi:ligand-binding SRPBCC domain-containing protein
MWIIMRRIKEGITIGVSRDAVWAALEDFGDVASWAPYMRRSALIGNQKTGVGTRRRLHHAWGFRIEECVTGWIDGRGFSFDVNRAPYPMKDVREAWVIERDNDRTIIGTSVEYDMHLGMLGLLLDKVFVQFVVRREMRAGLRGLKAFLERAGTRYDLSQERT